MPRASRASKLTWSGVIFSAAITRSPSASSCSSATITTMRPSRMRAKTSSSGCVAIPRCPCRRYYHCQFCVTSAGGSVRPRNRTSLDEGIVSDLPHGDIRKSHRIAHPKGREALHGGQSRAEDPGRDEERDSIDDPGAQGGTRQVRTPLEQNLAPSASREFRHHRLEIDRSISSRTADYLDTAPGVASPGARHVLPGGHQHRAGR